MSGQINSQEKILYLGTGIGNRFSDQEKEYEIEIAAHCRILYLHRRCVRMEWRDAGETRKAISEPRGQTQTTGVHPRGDCTIRPPGVHFRPGRNGARRQVARGFLFTSKEHVRKPQKLSRPGGWQV